MYFQCQSWFLMVKVGTTVGNQWSETKRAVWTKGSCWLIKDCMHCHFQYHLLGFNHVGQKSQQQPSPVVHSSCCPRVVGPSCIVLLWLTDGFAGIRRSTVFFELKQKTGTPSSMLKGLKGKQRYELRWWDHQVGTTDRAAYQWQGKPCAFMIVSSVHIKEI